MAEKANEDIAIERILEVHKNGEPKLVLRDYRLNDLPEEIFELTHITELVLSGNRLRKLSKNIGRLTNLQKLSLDYNGLTEIPKEIADLQLLQVLNITNNNFDKFPSEIYSLQNLRELHVGIGFPGQRINFFRELPMGIGMLINLEELEIGICLLKELPSDIVMLKKLKRLHASANEFQRIPNEIGQLEDLQILELGGNHIREPDFLVLEHLNKLTELDLSGNKISFLGKEIGVLKKLEFLDLSYNALSYLPPSIGQLKELVSINLESNQLNILPTEIGNLKKLETLNVSTNKLINIPAEIGNLNKLQNLILGKDKDRKDITSGNNISFIPSELSKLKFLKELNLIDNNLPIPPEILEKTYEPKTILGYYFSLIDGQKIPLCETKILVVGQGSVGKSSLMNRVIHNEFNPSELKTEGIFIDHLLIENLAKNNNQPPKIQLNTWDFGGQEIMHATHQFFLTKRSLYLLVLDSRLTQEENRVEYWLKIIQSFGGESPVLIIGNKIDQHPLDIDRTGLQKKYPNIVGILETSAATGSGIEELKAAITEQVNNLPHVRDLLPGTWFTIKTKLEELGHQSNFITHDKYLELCAENEVSDETSQRTLIGFLHDLGVVLHFQDDPRLEALGILNPQWVTNGVYKILNSHILFQNKGVLTVSMLDEILNLPEYPRGKRLFIVDMMKKFELCYEMPYGYDIESDKTFLVPDLLPKDEPAELKFNGVPAFEYAYSVLPSSVITRFIVRMNQKIEKGFVWRTGVVLKIGDNKALVKADIEDRKITISIDGMEHTRRETLTAIFYHLNDIHDSIKGLNPEKLVPVPGAENAKPISYNYLLMLEAKGIEILPVPDGNRLIDVNIRKVLSGVPNETQDKNREGVNNVTNIIVGGNFEGNLLVGDKNQVIQNSYNKIKSADISPELKETMKQLAEAVDVMLQKLPAEQASEVAEDFGKLTDEAVKSKPNQKWYSVSIEGLIKAAENLDKLGTPVISLSQKVLSLLTGGANKHAR